MTALPDGTNPVFDAADRLARLGISIIPIKAGTKEPPAGFKWGEFAKRIADVSERHNWFIEHDFHLAVVAGAVSGHLTPLDYDGAGGFESHAERYPVLLTFPRVVTGSGKTHVWVRLKTPSKKYVTTAPDGSRLEVRANVHYTLCPPSLHPSGKDYEWAVPPWGGIPVIELADIGLRAVTVTPAERSAPLIEGEPLTERERATIVALVEPHWVEYARHDLALAVAGWLTSYDVPEDDALAVVDELAAGMIDRAAEFARAVRDTYRKARAGVAVAGWAALTDRAAPLVSTATAKQLDLLLRGRDPLFTFDPPTEPAEPAIVREELGITLAELQTKTFAPIRWLVDGMVPEGALLICGKPKSKKSWLALNTCLAVSRGGRALGQLETMRGRVLYLDLEGNQRRIQTRVRSVLSEAVTWPDNFHVYTHWPAGDAGLRAIGAWFDQFPDTSLVVIDVLQDFRPPIGPKENPYDYDRNCLKAINRLAEERRATIILIHHTRKAKGEDALDEVSGTLGAPSAVNTIWVLSRSEDGKHTILKPRGRDLLNEDDLALRWDDFLCGHVIDGTADQLSLSAERTEILGVLADDQAHTLRDIAGALGKSVSALGHRLSALVAEGYVDKVGYGKYARVVPSPDQRPSKSSKSSK